MKDTIHFYRRRNDAYQIQTAMHQGKKHLIVPVTMMVEGVHRGSHGPLFHSISELGRYPAAWNGIPVVVNHPEIDGYNVSANDPDIIDSTVTVGRVYNTHVNGNRLRSDVWLDEEKVKQHPNLYQKLLALSMIEVSVGVFSDETPVENGLWNGEQYNAIATNHRPDHLALLPDAEGECSVEDGCGIRVNQKEGGKRVEDVKSKLTINQDSKETITSIVNNLSTGLQERLDQLRRKIDSLDNTSGSVLTYNYLQEAYDEYVVYEQRIRPGEGSSGVTGSTKLLKQAYAINNGSVEFVGDPVEVFRKVEYEPIVNEKTMIRNSSTKKEVNTMSAEKCTPCVEKKVNALIANKQLSFTEEDRTWLSGLEENQLDRMIPAAPQANAEEKTETEEVKTEPMVQKLTLSAEDQAALDFGRMQLKKQRDTFINGIQANTSKELWPDAELAKMDFGTLERMYKSVQRETVDYSLNAQNGQIQGNAGNVVAPMAPTGISFEQKK